MKIIKYTIIAIFLIVVSKWILTLLPSSYSNSGTIIEKTETSIKVEHTFKNLKGDIKKDFDNVEKDINANCNTIKIVQKAILDMKNIHEVSSCFECNWMCIFDSKLNKSII